MVAGTRVVAVRMKRRDWKAFYEVEWPEHNGALWPIKGGYKFIDAVSTDSWVL